MGLIPGWGAKISHDLWPKKQNIRQKRYCNKFSKNFKNGLQKKKKFRRRNLNRSVDIKSILSILTS